MFAWHPRSSVGLHALLLMSFTDFVKSRAVTAVKNTCIKCENRLLDMHLVKYSSPSSGEFELKALPRQISSKHEVVSPTPVCVQGLETPPHLLSLSTPVHPPSTFAYRSKPLENLRSPSPSRHGSQIALSWTGTKTSTITQVASPTPKQDECQEQGSENFALGIVLRSSSRSTSGSRTDQGGVLRAGDACKPQHTEHTTPAKPGMGKTKRVTSPVQSASRKKLTTRLDSYKATWAPVKKRSRRPARDLKLIPVKYRLWDLGFVPYDLEEG